MAGLLGALRDPEFYRGLLDNTRQLSGGLLAGTVGAPVDILTMLMRPTGYNVPDKKVIGSSEHIGGLLGLDTGSTPYKVGSLLPTDPSDALKYGGLLAGSMKGGKAAMTKIDDATGLPLNPDGTVTVFHGTTKDAAEKIRKEGALKAAAEPDVYVTTTNKPVGYGDGTVIAIRVKPELLRLDDEFPDGRKDFAIPVGKPGGRIRVKVDD